MLCPRQGANCCYIDNVKLLQDLIKKDKWEDWFTQNSFTYLNEPDAFTRSDAKGKKTSPDITVCHNSWINKCHWTPQYRNPGGSDHLPILTTIKLKDTQPSAKTLKRTRRKRFSYIKADWDLFREEQDTELQEWPIEEWSVKTLSSKLSLVFTKAAEKAIPKGNIADTKPFWNNDIQEALKASNDARKDAHLSDQHAEHYKAMRKNYLDTTDKAKEASWREFASDLDRTTSSSKVWNTIQALDGRSRKKKSGTPSPTRPKQEPQTEKRPTSSSSPTQTRAVSRRTSGRTGPSNWHTERLLLKSVIAVRTNRQECAARSP